MADIIQIRRDSSANWIANNPTLAEGEIGYDISVNKWKVGNAADVWTALSYVDTQGATGLTGSTGVQGNIGMDGATGVQGIQGETGIQGKTGVQGQTGIVNFRDSSSWDGPAGETPILLFNRQDEALYAGVTGLSWIQVSSGSLQGATGEQGITGVMPVLDRTDFPAFVAPIIMWNREDEALYAGVTGIGGNWVQISAGGAGGGDTTNVYLPTDNITLQFTNGLLTGVS
jgi:hypothetical protein